MKKSTLFKTGDFTVVRYGGLTGRHTRAAVKGIEDVALAIGELR